MIKSEWQLLAKIKNKIDKTNPAYTDDLIKSIGDDCAVFRLNGDDLALLTSDISIESVHFRRDLSSPEDIGFRCMMANISDIVAMGGECGYSLVSLGIPKSIGDEYVMRIYDGMIEAANMAHLGIVGGDISLSGEIVISISLYGTVKSGKLTLRSGAKPGDYIYLTGYTGSSMAGLEILKDRAGDTDNYPGLVKRYNRPCARYDIINAITQQFSPGAMIDVSDGILSDLRHICDESHSGFRLNRKKIPVSEELLRYVSSTGADLYKYILTSGEEYELLFTSAKTLTDSMSIAINGIGITPIGVITDSGFFIEDENGVRAVEITGYDHFK
jgi:thiamine-monophosphate kinase